MLRVSHTLIVVRDREISKRNNYIAHWNNFAHQSVSQVCACDGVEMPKQCVCVSDTRRRVSESHLGVNGASAWLWRVPCGAARNSDANAVMQRIFTRFLANNKQINLLHFKWSGKLSAIGVAIFDCVLSPFSLWFALNRLFEHGVCEGKRERNIDQNLSFGSNPSIFQFQNKKKAIKFAW